MKIKNMLMLGLRQTQYQKKTIRQITNSSLTRYHHEYYPTILKQTYKNRGQEWLFMRAVETF